MMYKDITNKDEIHNGPYVQPFHSISAQHTWIKRNILYYSNNGTDYAVYLSGSNLVLYDLTTDSMSLIPLRSDCVYTSLSFGTNQSDEKLVVVGEKLKPLNYESELPNFRFVVAPRVYNYIIILLLNII